MGERTVTFASLLLCACMFASGACGVVLEYIQASLASMILGNSFEQWALVIGLMLFWMGVGSLIQARIPKQSLIYTFIFIEIGLALFGGFSPVLTYLAFGHTAHYQLILYTFVSFIGTMIGLEIPVIIRINNDFSRELSTNLGNILSADYIGSLAGALVYVYILLKYFPITEAAFLTAGMNFFLALVTFVYFSQKRLIRARIPLGAVMAATAAALVWGGVNNRDWAIRLEQPLYDDPVVLSRTTRYQHIVLTHFRPFDEIRLFLNGNLQLNSRDEARYHEPLVHPAMGLAQVKERVLILGGGDGCALREVLKYPAVKEVLLVDLDPEMTALAASHPLLTRINADAFRDARVVTLTGEGISEGPHRMVHAAIEERKGTPPLTQPLARVRVLNLDADLFLAKVPGYWNVIIVDMPDPSSPEVAKLYTREFYAKLTRHLSRNGMMAVQATSPYFAKESFLCIGRTIRAAGFKTVPYHENVPSFGDWGFYLAFFQDAQQVRDRIKALEIPVDTRFLTPDGFRSELVFGKGLLETEHTAINTLLYPALLNFYNYDSWQTD